MIKLDFNNNKSYKNVQVQGRIIFLNPPYIVYVVF